MRVRVSGDPPMMKRIQLALDEMLVSRRTTVRTGKAESDNDAA